MAKYSNFFGKDAQVLESMHVSTSLKNGKWFAKLYDGEFYYHGEGGTENGALSDALNEYYSDLDED